eukprot:403336985
MLQNSGGGSDQKQNNKDHQEYEINIVSGSGDANGVKLPNIFKTPRDTTKYTRKAKGKKKSNMTSGQNSQRSNKIGDILTGKSSKSHVKLEDDDHDNDKEEDDLALEIQENQDEEEEKNMDVTPKDIGDRALFSKKSSMNFRGSDTNKNQSEGAFIGKYSQVLGSDVLGQTRAILAQQDIGGTPNDGSNNKSMMSGLNMFQNLDQDDRDIGNNPPHQVNNQYQKQYLSKFQGLNDLEKDLENLVGNNEEEIKVEAKKRMRGEITNIHDQLERMDTNYTELEDIFADEIRSKEMDIEHLDPQEMMQKESIIEFNELKRLEKQMRRVEKEKVTLLKNENKSETKLYLEQGKRGLTLEELEAQYEFKAQERERALTKLYGRLNAKIKSQILSNEGTSKFQVRKIPPYMKDKYKDKRLFEGIRDQRVGARWLKTPQPVEIKCQMVRGLKDKVPKGNYVIRCGVLDRMIENKIYYKFLEYGAKLKAEEEARLEREAERKIENELHIIKEKQNLLFQNTSNNSSQRAVGEPHHQVEPSEQIDDEEKQLIIFHQDSDDENGNNSMKFDNEEDNQDNHRVQFGQGTRYRNENDNERSPNKFFKQGSFKQNNQKTTDPEELKKQKFEDMARQSLYKPQGGSLTANAENQNLEKVWIDFGKQHTKLIDFEASHDSEEMNFNGHKIYFVVPPNMYLQPSNVLIFELIWLSSQTQREDFVVAWGAFPLVNGDFEINEGKFKLPLLNGGIDFSSNKFKDIEKKYIRNVDEWLGNLYIEVKRFDLVDFQMYNKKIEFKVLKEEKKPKDKKDKKGRKTVDKIEDEDSDHESEFDADQDKQYMPVGDNDQIDYHSFRYKVNQSNYDLKNQFENQDLTIRKIQYVTVIWLRMVFHYLGQYLVLKAMNAPVMSLDLSWYKIKINYAFWNIGQEVAVITVGVVSNTLILAMLILICYLSQKYIYCFPRSFCRFIAWFGIATVFDFFLIAVIDFAVQDWKGDLFKLYIYYSKSNSSGFVGYFLTFIIQLGLLIINLFIFYNYVVFVHLDGRLADIWSRISGKVKNFYIPHDNEVSFNYLRNLYQIGEINNNRIIVNMVSIYNSLKPGLIQKTKLVHFYKFESEVSLQQGRVFHANERGQIYELNLDQIGTQNDDSNLEYYLKNVNSFMKVEYRSPIFSERENDQQTKVMGQEDVFQDTLKKLKRRMTIQSASGHMRQSRSFIGGQGLNNTFDKREQQKSIQSLTKQSPMKKKDSTQAFGQVKQLYENIKKMNTFSAKSRKSNASHNYQQIQQSQMDSFRGGGPKIADISRKLKDDEKLQLREQSPLKTDEDMYTQHNDNTKNPFRRLDSQDDEEKNFTKRSKQGFHDEDLNHRQSEDEEANEQMNNRNAFESNNHSPDARNSLIKKLGKSQPNSTKNKKKNQTLNIKASKSGKTSPKSIGGTQKVAAAYGSGQNTVRSSVKDNIAGNTSKVVSNKSSKKGGKDRKKNSKSQRESIDFFKNDEKQEKQGGGSGGIPANFANLMF